MRVRLAGVAMAVLVCSVAFAQVAQPNPLDRSRVFAYGQMKARRIANGSETRDFFTGTLATGEVVSVHESAQPAGTVPPKLHVIQHSEFIVIQEGTVEYHHDGAVEKAGAGDVLYVKCGASHFVANVGTGPAKYTVIQIGGDVKK